MPDTTDSTTVEPDSPTGELDPDSTDVDTDDETEPDTFDREYVEQLRTEAAENRVKAKRAQEFAEEVFYSRVSAFGKLADPTDLTFDEALLDDRAALESAVDDLIGRKPHLADRRPTGDVDQGARGTTPSINLADMLRART